MQGFWKRFTLQCLCSPNSRLDECSYCRRERVRAYGVQCLTCEILGHVCTVCSLYGNVSKDKIKPAKVYWQEKEAAKAEAKRMRTWHGLMYSKDEKTVTLVPASKPKSRAVVSVLGGGTISTSFGQFNISEMELMVPSSFPVEKQDKPIKAYKACNISLKLNQFTGERKLIFHPVGINTGGDFSYAAVDEMKCAQVRGANHTTPQKHCSCGFYAFKELDDAGYNITGGFYLEVELYGRVLECSKGYRAQKQRIVSIRPRAFCTECGKHTSVITIGPPAMSLIPVCVEHTGIMPVISIADLRATAPSLWVFSSRFMS